MTSTTDAPQPGGFTASTTEALPRRLPTAFSRRRYHEVDLLRLVAALGVLGFHFMFRASTTQPVLGKTGFHDPAGIFHYGNIGVPLFFVISGFVILNSAWNRTPMGFLSARIGRLYPAFWVACTITAIVMALEPADRFTISITRWLMNLTMFSQAYGVDYVDGVYWTLTIELAFYLIVLAFVKIGINTNRVIGFGMGWLALSAVNAVWHAPDWLTLLLVPAWAPYFVAGMLFALIARNGWKWKFAAPLLAAYVACGYYAEHYFGVLGARWHVGYSPVVIAAVVTAIFLIFAAIVSGATLPGAKWLAVTAGLTYPLYLLHENIGYSIFTTLNDHGVNRWVTLSVVLAVVVALAWAVHTLVENRFAKPLATVINQTWESLRTSRIPLLARK